MEHSYSELGCRRNQALECGAQKVAMPRGRRLLLGTSALSLAAAMTVITVSLAQPTPAQADVTINTPVTGTQTFGDSDNVTVLQPGKIDVTYTGSDTSVFGLKYTGSGAYSKTITNNGAINLDVYFTTGSRTTVAGIYINDAVSGSILNNGSIDVDAENNDKVTAYGIYTTGLLSGVIQNTGTITVTDKQGDTASAAGIQVENDVSGSIINSGTITVNQNVTDTSLNAYGIHVSRAGDGLLAGGNITNTSTGTIAVNAVLTAYGQFYEVFGVGVEGDISGTLTNAGTINVDASALNNGSAYTVAGIYSETVKSGGKILNSGLIDVSFKNNGSSGAVSNLAGIYLNGTIDAGGSIENSGTINVTAAVAGTGATNKAYGMHVELSGASDFGGILTNSSAGGINVNLTAESGSANAYGINVDTALITGTIENKGQIAVTVDHGGTWASAYGIYSVVDIAGSVSNQGTVAVSLSAAQGSGFGGGLSFYDVIANKNMVNTGTVSVTVDAANKAKAWGLLAQEVHGTISNSGAITATADAANGDAYAQGIRVTKISEGGTVSNQGKISVDAVAANGIHIAAGFWVDNDFVGTLSNSGTVEAFEDGEMSASAYSVYIDSYNASSPGTVRNLAGGELVGSLNLKGGASLSNTGVVWLPEDANLGGAGTADDYAAYISGSFTNTSSGVLKVQVYGADPAEHSQLVVGGTVNLDGGLYVNVRDDRNGPLEVGQVVQDVVKTNTSGGITGNFATVKDNSSLFNFESVIDGDTVDLNITKGTTIYEATKAQKLRPAYGAAKTLDTLAFGPAGAGDMQGVIDAFATLETEKEVADAAYQTLPLLTGGASRLVRDMLTVSSLSVDDRINGLSGQMSDVKEVSGNFWIDPIGAWTQQDEMDKSSGYSSSLYGVVAGVDGQINSALSMGAAFAYSNTSANSVSSIVDNSAVVNSYQAILYGMYAMESGTLLRYQFDGGLHNTDGRRRMNFGFGDDAINSTAKSDYSNTSLHASGSVEHSFAIGDRTKVTPRLKADYVSVWSGQYDETGAGPLNLSVDSGQYQTLVFSADGRLEHQLTETVRLEASAGLGYDALNQRSEVTAAYSGAPGLSFDVEGMQSDAWVAQAGASISVQATDDFRLSASYNAIFRDGLLANMAGIEANWRF